MRRNLLASVALAVWGIASVGSYPSALQVPRPDSPDSVATDKATIEFLSLLANSSSESDQARPIPSPSGRRGSELIVERDFATSSEYVFSIDPLSPIGLRRHSESNELREEPDIESSELREATRSTGVRIGNPTSFPWRTNCKIVTVFPSGKTGEASAVLVGDRFILTAAHVLFSTIDGGWAKLVMVAPAFSEGQFPFGATYVVASRIPQAFITNDEPGSDWAVAALKTRVGARTGWMRFGHVSNVVGRESYSVSYPLLVGGRTQWFVEGKIDKATDSYIGVPVLTGPGSSGAGLYVVSSNGTRTVIGVEVGGSPGESYSWFTRLNPYRVQVINDFMKKYR